MKTNQVLSKFFAQQQQLASVLDGVKGDINQEAYSQIVTLLASQSEAVDTLAKSIANARAALEG
ncbi:hypothetical protein OQC17_004603 [Salmonella enterica]|nr:hypothetical protein [Salmonella enterica]